MDPTGCGDAYRAGLIHGLLHGLDWHATGQIASLMGAIKIESLGTQNHRFTPARVRGAGLQESFGTALLSCAGTLRDPRGRTGRRSDPP